MCSFFKQNELKGGKLMKPRSKKQTALVVVALLISVLFLTGCETTGPKTALGGLGGAAAGGLLAAGLGAHPAAIAGSVLLGGLVGGLIGNQLDAADRRMAAQTAQNSLEYSPTGVETSWRNPDSGHHGTIIPVGTYRLADGSYCREYSQTVYVGREQESAYGKACRQPDGSWKIVN